MPPPPAGTPTSRPATSPSASPEQPATAARRITARRLGIALPVGALREAARLRPVDAAWAFALRAGLAVAVPLVALTAAGRPELAGIATFGSFAALYARDVHYRSRGTVVALAGLGLVAC